MSPFYTIQCKQVNAYGIWGLAEYAIETAVGVTDAAVDGIPATAAFLRSPSDVAVDRDGNLYLTEWHGHRVRKIDPFGIVSTLAGTGDWGFSGDGGQATQAMLNHPFAIAADALGNLYVAEREGKRIRRIDPSGVITTFAGTGVRGYSGDGGPATLARLEHPLGVATDSAGNVYVAEDDGERVRKIDGSGVITTYAGAGDEDDGSPAAEARVRPFGIAADTLGNIWFAPELPAVLA